MLSKKHCDFLGKAKTAHGERYDYSMVDYNDAHTKIHIICAKHGGFHQKPMNHTNRGQGCPKCSGIYTRTLEDFLREAKEVHGNEYDYTQVELIDYSTIKIKIVCRVHGIFEQLPRNHVGQKHGCPDCNNRRRIDTETFISDVREIHGDRYDYSKLVYIGMHGHVTIICREHGPFEQIAQSHFSGSTGCKKCRHDVYNQESFIKKASEVHNNMYDYRLVEYTNSAAHVNIICSIHGSFSITSNSHVQGFGCGKCGRARGANMRRKSLEAFIADAQAMHGERYDYSNVEYVSTAHHVEIICVDHGCFSQNAQNHLSGAGCPRCANCHRRTQQDFLQEASVVHGKKYDYSKSEFTSVDNHVSIICDVHGEFRQIAKLHLNGRGCQKCTSPLLGLDTASYKKRATAVHGGIYNYDALIFSGLNNKVEVFCDLHQQGFRQHARNHLLGMKGCKGCVDKSHVGGGHSLSQIRWLEFLAVREGVTFQHAENGGEKFLKDIGRVDGYNAKLDIVAEFHGDYWHGNPIKFHPDKINAMCKRSYGDLYAKTVARDQKITESHQRYIVIWENEWLSMIRAVKKMHQA